MDLTSFKDQHVQILKGINQLRQLARQGIAENAAAIATGVVELSSIIKVHLAVEDRLLYPSVQRLDNPALAAMGQAYQTEMKDIAAAYAQFSRRWNTPTQIQRSPEGFRADANTVLKTIHARMQRENTHFYPAIETA